VAGPCSAVASHTSPRPDPAHQTIQAWHQPSSLASLKRGSISAIAADSSSFSRRQALRARRTPEPLPTLL